MIKAAFVLLINKDKVLLVQEGGELSKGLWSFPGGHIDVGESTEQGAIREAYEETGYIVKLNKLIKEFSFTSKYYKGNPADSGMISVTIYQGEILSGKLTQDNESLDLKWVNINKLNTLPLRWPEIIEVIKK